jgi:hypothetical protein
MTTANFDEQRRSAIAQLPALEEELKELDKEQKRLEVGRLGGFKVAGG